MVFFFSPFFSLFFGGWWGVIKLGLLLLLLKFACGGAEARWKSAGSGSVVSEVGGSGYGLGWL